MEPREKSMEETTVNSRTKISEPNPSNEENRNSSKDETVLEKTSDELESIQMEDEVKNVLMTIINLLINSGDAKAMVRPVESRQASRATLQQNSTGINQLSLFSGIVET
jgi:hypothetical protein